MATPFTGTYESFPTTQWSWIRRASEDLQARRAEMGRLLACYLPALKAHLVFRLHLKPDQADDLLQGFVSDKIIEENLLRCADPERGRFRSFLLTSLNNFVLNEWRYEHSQRRSPGRLANLADHEPWLGSGDNGPDTFDVAWARELLAEALRRMESDCRASGRPDLWGVFEARIVLATFQGIEPMPYDELVRRFGFESPAQASNALITAKRMFIRILRGLIAEYAGDERDIDTEISELRDILSRCGA